jgi:hypothetical protein
MKRVLLSSLGCLAAIVIASAASLAPVTIQHVAVKGQKLTYNTTGKITVAGMEGEISSKSTDTILDVATDGTYTTENTQSDFEFNGMPVPIPGGATKIVVKPSGELVSLTGPDGGTDGARAQALTSFYFPSKAVEVNDTWSYEGKKDDKLGTSAFKADMKYLGDEKVGSVDTYKVQVDSKETDPGSPATLHSTVWLDKTDGSMLKVISTFTNLPAPGGYTIDGTMTITKAGS